MRVSFIPGSRTFFVALALCAGGMAARGADTPPRGIIGGAEPPPPPADAAEPRQYVRGQQGAQRPSGVVNGWKPGMHLADVAQTRDHLVMDGDVAPPVRCWWNRVDVWNGYVYSPRRFRVCN